MFYDRDELSWGDNWKEKTLCGIQNSEFGIIVISESFFGREWTVRELHEFMDCQNRTGQKTILPILHNITFDILRKKHPELESIQALESENTTPKEVSILLAIELLKRQKSKL